MRRRVIQLVGIGVNIVILDEALRVKKLAIEEVLLSAEMKDGSN